MTRAAILAAIDAERAYQDERWGHVADDTLNSPNDWVAFIAHHSSRWRDGSFAPHPAETVAAFRKQMIKAAALAVAAIESLDRQTEASGAPFYQKPG